MRDSRRCSQRNEDQTQTAHAWEAAGAHRDRRTRLQPCWPRLCVLWGGRNPYLSWGGGWTSRGEDAGDRQRSKAGPLLENLSPIHGHTQATPPNPAWTQPRAQDADAGCPLPRAGRTLGATPRAVSPSSAASGSPGEEPALGDAKRAGGGSPEPPGQGPSLTLAFPSYRLGGEPQVMGTGAGTPGLGWGDGPYFGVWVSICFSPSSQGCPCESQRGLGGGCGLGAGWPGGRGLGHLSLQDQGPGTGRGTQACASRARTCTLGRQNQDGGSSLLGLSSWNRMWRKKSPV